MHTLAIPRLRWLVAFSLVAMLGTLVAPPTPADASIEARAHEVRFVDSLNVERATRGTARLMVASDLRDVARRHSARMARDSHLHHNPNLGSDVSGWSRVGENVGRGGSVSSLHRALMNSEGHRRNMLDSNFTEIGVGVVVSGSTIWVTQVFRLPSGQITAVSFRDVLGSSHATNIQRLFDSGVTSGCNATSYCPTNPVTRAQMGTFLARSAKLMPSSSDPFSDLGRAPLHRANISALADEGITGGCTATAFCPDRSVTRAQMATFLANALGLERQSGSRFADVPSSSTHAGAINAIADAGITMGCSTSNYCPNDQVSRAEMASFLVRAFKL